MSRTGARGPTRTSRRLHARVSHDDPFPFGAHPATVRPPAKRLLVDALRPGDEDRSRQDLLGSTIRWDGGQDAPPGIPDVDSAPPRRGTDPAQSSAPPTVSRNPIRQGAPLVLVPHAASDEVPAETRTPPAPMSTARSRRRSAVSPFATPPRSTLGCALSLLAMRRHWPMSLRSRRDGEHARRALARSRSSGASVAGSPDPSARPPPAPSHSAAKAPMSGVNTPPVASDRARASTRRRSVYASTSVHP